MSNFLQNSHKMIAYQMKTLDGLNNEATLERLADIAGVHGAVQSIRKLGEERYRDKLMKMYLISFEKAEEAMSAAYNLEGKVFGKTSVVLMLH